jgi:hypothetical protein
MNRIPKPPIDCPVFRKLIELAEQGRDAEV